MRVDRHIAVSAGWVGGPAFGVAMMAAPEYLHLSHTVAAIAFWGGLVVFALTLVIVFVVSAEDRRPRGRELGPLILMAGGLAIFGAGAGWYLWPHGGNVAKRNASQPPKKIQDETTIKEWSPQIKLIGPKNPALGSKPNQAIDSGNPP